jgi:hypothetical protein
MAGEGKQNRGTGVQVEQMGFLFSNLVYSRYYVSSGVYWKRVPKIF